MLSLKKIKEAKIAAREAVTLDPDDADYYCSMPPSLTPKKTGRKRWTGAKRAWYRSDQPDCLNFRAMALVKLGRADQAHDTIHRACRKNRKMPSAMPISAGRCCMPEKAIGPRAFQRSITP
jgi:hypothetical protein